MKEVTQLKRKLRHYRVSRYDTYPKILVNFESFRSMLKTPLFPSVVNPRQMFHPTMQRREPRMTPVAFMDSVPEHMLGVATGNYRA